MRSEKARSRVRLAASFRTAERDHALSRRALWRTAVPHDRPRHRAWLVQDARRFHEENSVRNTTPPTSRTGAVSSSMPTMGTGMFQPSPRGALPPQCIRALLEAMAERPWGHGLVGLLQSVDSMSPVTVTLVGRAAHPGFQCTCVGASTREAFSRY